jgi:hypothetical protein
MALITIDDKKLDRILRELADIRRVVLPDNKRKWVRVGTIIKELKLTRQQIRYAREKNEGIARKKTSGHYEYDLIAYKQIAA